MGLWSEDSVSAAWGLCWASFRENYVKDTGCRFVREVGRLVRVIEGDVLVNAI
jgi:hypothetical protein